MDQASVFLGSDWASQTLLGLRMDAWFTAGVLLVVVGGLVYGKIGADLILLSGMAALLAVGILEPAEALAGFANPAVATVGLLYIVAAGLRETGAMTDLTAKLLRRPKSLVAAQFRLTVPVAVGSAFVNNTPIVAMFLPVLDSWARRNNLSASRLFMPLSFAAVLGGMCTLIGTSTNLVVAGLITQHIDDPALAGASTAEGGFSIEPLGMFTLALVGVPVALAGLGYMLLFGRRLLRDSGEAFAISQDPREYMTAMRVTPGPGVAGQTVEKAGLRHLPGLYLARIERGGETILAPGPDQVLQPGDVLGFVGVVDSVVDLQKIKGLSPVAPEEEWAQAASTPAAPGAGTPRHSAKLIEAVISTSSPLLRRSIRDAAFRTRYGAVVIAVHRNGQRLGGKLGDIELRAGDTLLLEAPPDFAARHRDSRDFYLVSELPGAAAPRHHLAGVSIGILIALVALITWAPSMVMPFALIAALLMVLTRCCTGPQARQSVDWQILLVIGSAFGLGRAMETTGLAALIAGGLLDWAAAFGPWALLGVLYLVTAAFTSIITNNAAAVLVFPIALQAARDNDLAFLPFAVVVAIASSAGFATPLGYQTNLMVMGPGGYSPRDFMRFGLPLTILAGLICVGLSPLIYGMT